MSDRIHQVRERSGERGAAELFDLHQGRSLFKYPANAARGNFASGQGAQCRIGLRCFQCHEQSAGGLRIEKKVAEVLRNSSKKCNTIAAELAIIPKIVLIEHGRRGGPWYGQV